MAKGFGETGNTRETENTGAAENSGNTENAGSSRGNRMTLLAVNLLLLVACAAGLVLVIAVYLIARPRASQPPSPSAAVLNPSLTPTPILAFTFTPTASVTPRPTSSPTITPAPSWSPTPTLSPTVIPVPSLTPAAALAFEGAYGLAYWGSAQADRLVQLMQAYPAGILPGTSQANLEAYYQAFRYPIFAIQEALLRYPDADEAEQWRWMLAYDLALAGDVRAGDRYAELIADNLNRDQVSLSELYAWFAIQEPQLQFFMVKAPTPPEALASYVVELRSEGGSAFIWLLEKSGAFQAFSLYTMFDFVHPRQANWILAELDNDTSDGDEIAIYFSSLPGETELQPPRVFNLSKDEPVSMRFIPDKDIFPVGMDFTNYWELQTGATGQNELVFDATVFPACPVHITRAYRWTGVYFKPVDTQIVFGDLPEDLGQCETLFDTALHFWGPETAVSLMETLLPSWPPAVDAQGEPYPADELDAFRFRLGVYKALAGDDQGAIALFNQISTEPVVLTSRWIEPAQKFLAAYQKPQDIYLACQFAPYCDPAIAIRVLAAQIPSNLDALEYLKKWHVEPISSGFFDFEGDGESERWFIVRNATRETPSFWILPRGGGHYAALLVGTVESQRPALIEIDEAYIADAGLKYQPAALLDGRISISMQRYPDTNMAYLVSVPLREEYPSRFFVPVAADKEALFAGSSPELIQKNLEDLQVSPGLLCKTTWTCDEYYYLLGLASELANDDLSAASAYQFLWLNYSKSPFTQLARLKLAPTGAIAVPTVTITLTPTLTPPPPTATVSITPATATPTATLTPTITGTPPTATPAPTATSAPVVPTHTATATQGSGGYPYPIPTITSGYP